METVSEVLRSGPVFLLFVILTLVIGFAWWLTYLWLSVILVILLANLEYLGSRQKPKGNLILDFFSSGKAFLLLLVWMVIGPFLLGKFSSYVWWPLVLAILVATLYRNYMSLPPSAEKTVKTHIKKKKG